MKTTVMGVFPQLPDAERVLGQLVASTLDVDAIRVLHTDPGTQRALAQAAGLPADRSMIAGTTAGALLGGAMGFGLGLTPALPLSEAGPLFLGALGLLLGAAAGAAVSAATDALPVPRAQLPELAEIVDRGATVVLVRTDSLPTARAIRDLFQANGSEVLTPVEEDEEEAAVAPALVLARPVEPGEPAALASPPPSAPGAAETAVPEAHAPFVPPWRRLLRGGRSPDGPAVPPPVPEPAVAPWERPAPPEAEPLMYQPPEAADLAEDAAPARRGADAAPVGAPPAAPDDGEPSSPGEP